MNYQDWLKEVPATITDDPLWRTEIYRQALFLGDIAWHDACALVKNRITVALADQLYRAASSIGANIAEGYSRASGRDQARFYEYALGSSRETRDWYFKARHVLGSTVVQHRLQYLTHVIRQLMKMVPKYRDQKLSGKQIKEDHARYSVSVASEYLDNMPSVEDDAYAVYPQSSIIPNHLESVPLAHDEDN